MEGVLQNGALSFDKSELILSFFDPTSRKSMIHFVKIDLLDEMNVRESIESHGSINKQLKVVSLSHSGEPIVLEQGFLVTVALEYMPSKVILGLDEPGYFLVDRTSVERLTFIEDREVKNKVCSQILPLKGLDNMLIARNRT